MPHDISRLNDKGKVRQTREQNYKGHAKSNGTHIKVNCVSPDTRTAIIYSSTIFVCFKCVSKLNSMWCIAYTSLYSISGQVTKH